LWLYGFLLLLFGHAAGVNINSVENVGRSYVVFGKIDSTVINLSSIVAGTGGFVINGGQKVKGENHKATNNDLQNTTQKT
jgi:hypothetical protein